MNNYKHFEEYGLPEEMMREFLLLQVPKLKIADLVKEQLQEKNLTYRQAAEKIDDFSYTQLSRITTGANYTIDTLLKALDCLDLELEVKKKDS